MSMSDPIQVNPSQLPGGAGTLVRYLIATVGGVLLSKGFLPEGTNVEQLTGAAMSLIAFGWGLYRTVTNKRKLVTAADAAPNHVAVVTK
jgi:hypothetical protein